MTHRIIKRNLDKPIIKDLLGEIVEPGRYILFTHASKDIRFGISLKTQWDNCGTIPKLRVLAGCKRYACGSNKHEPSVRQELLQQNHSVIIVNMGLIQEEYLELLNKEYDRILIDPKLRKKYID